MCRLAAFLLVLPLAAALCPEDAFQGTRPEDCYMYGPAQSWQDAEQFCVSNKGHLTSVPNAFVNSFLISYPKMFSSAQLYWLGAVISGDIDMWTWVDGSSFDYTKWAAGEPKQGPGCLSVNASTGQWKSDDCLASKPFSFARCRKICKPAQKCDGGWTFNERLNKGYPVFSTGTPRMPPAAMRVLIFRPFIDDDENAAFAEVARGYPIVALGLKNMFILPFGSAAPDHTQFSFAWDDGSFVDYTPLPSDHAADEENWKGDCAFFQKERAAKWLLMDCRQPTEMATAVCQKSPREA
ncbi:Protein CLEC-51 [Aphelenchoides avenae]|nr:Protein CLEC-51 [Aphelenchus avenae]